MANREQVKLLKQSVGSWNRWREENPDVEVDLIEANLRGTDLQGVNLRKADLSDANLNGANLNHAVLRQADLTTATLRKVNLRNANLIDAYLEGSDFWKSHLEEADLAGANLSYTNFEGAFLHKAHLSNVNLTEANMKKADLTEAHLDRAHMEAVWLSHADLTNARLSGADLREAHLDGACLRAADLSETNLGKADLRRADLTDTDLTGATLIGANIEDAKLTGSKVYGVSVWDLEGKFREQKDLIITNYGEPEITVDNVKVAQFIYLILNNSEIRDVINTLTSKSVLILGRFSIPERKSILDVLRNKLREYDLLPIVFDFDRPTDKDFTETIKTLAGLSYFVIADITNPKSSPLELQATVPDYEIPFVPIIQEGESPFAMLVDLQKKHEWVLNTVSYDTEETLIKVLKPLIIDPAMKKRQELRIIKAQEPEIISAKDYLAKGRK